MGVVTRGMGGTGCLGGVREGARAAAARGAAARASGEELGKVTVGGNETGVSGTSVARARGADAGASAKRGALVPAERDEHHRSTRRRVGATKETTVDDLPDHLLEVVFGHLAADSKPREYFDAMLTCSRFRAAGVSKHALARADEKLLDIKAAQWFRGARAFANAAVAAGSARAAFFVGSVDFYCEGSDADARGHADTRGRVAAEAGSLVPPSLASREDSRERHRSLEQDDAPSGNDGASFRMTLDPSSLQSSRDARRARGASLLARAATAGVREAHHTLAVMHFNGSGGRRRDKDPEAGAALCARGNLLFDCVSAKRELGHCLQDGFGVERDAALGAKLLDEAAAADAKSGKGLDAAVLAASAAAAIVEERLRKRNDINTLNAAVAAAAEVAAAAKNAAAAHLTATRENRFLLDWYGDGAASDPAKKPLQGPFATLPTGTTSCSHPLCGRVETRRHEFRRCSCCGRVRYCSRSCQGADWRLQHKFACLPLLELYGWSESDAESVEGEEQGEADEETPVFAQPCV